MILYHGKLLLNHDLGEDFFNFSNHFKQIEVILLIEEILHHLRCKKKLEIMG